jgi:RNA polymerase sigma factor (sigma-70 family)
MGMGSSDEWIRLRQTLLGITRRYRVTSAEAEDVVQTVLERLVAHYSQVTSAGILLSEPYLRQMCMNALRSEYRARIRRWRRENVWAELSDAIDSPEDMFLERAAGAQAFVAFSKVAASLPSPVVWAFLLCDVSGLPAPKAALFMGVPEGTVRTWLRRVRASLSEVACAMSRAA